MAKQNEKEPDQDAVDESLAGHADSPDGPITEDDATFRAKSQGKYSPPQPDRAEYGITWLSACSSDEAQTLIAYLSEKADVFEISIAELVQLSAVVKNELTNRPCSHAECRFTELTRFYHVHYQDSEDPIARRVFAALLIYSIRQQDLLDSWL